MKKILTLLLVLFGISLFVFADEKNCKSIDDFMKETEDLLKAYGY